MKGLHKPSGIRLKEETERLILGVGVYDSEDERMMWRCMVFWDTPCVFAYYGRDALSRC